MPEESADASRHGVVLSLFDRSGIMVRPWAKAGYECIAVDIQNDGSEEAVGDGIIYYVEKDIKEYLPPRTDFVIAFAFPPCTNLAVSGARWFEQKGIDGLAAGLELVERAKRLLTWTDAPWMLENPVSTISSYWRDPDHTFHPYEFDPYTDRDEAYCKRTCLWTGNGFEMPDPHPDAPDDGDDRIHKMAPSDDRSDERAETPLGFSRAVFETNQKQNDASSSRPPHRQKQNDASIVVPENARKRDEVWMAVIDLFQERQQIQKSQIVDRVSAAPRTVQDVLGAMRDAGLVNHTPGSRYWNRAPALSRFIGHPTPTGGVGDAD